MIYLLTFNGVPEAFRGGGVVGRCVKNVNLQTVSHILRLWEALHHRPVHVSCRVSSDGSRFRACRERGKNPDKTSHIDSL